MLMPLAHIAVQGTYRGSSVTHHVDPSTGLNVIRDSSGNFLSGWKLSPQQLQHVLSTGKTWRGLMSRVHVDYGLLFEQFLTGAMSAEEFQAIYLDRFKKELPVGGGCLTCLTTCLAT